MSNYYLRACTNTILVSDIDQFKAIIDNHKDYGVILITNGERVGFHAEDSLPYMIGGIHKLGGDIEEKTLLQQLSPLTSDKEPLYYFQIGFDNYRMNSIVYRVTPS